MIYNQNPIVIEPITTVNEAVSDSNVLKVIKKIFKAIKDALVAAWNYIKKIFSSKAEDGSKTFQATGDASTTINDPDSKTATVNNATTVKECRNYVKVNFGPLYENGLNGVESLIDSFESCIEKYKAIMAAPSTGNDLRQTAQDMFVTIADAIGAETNPTTWKDAMNNLCGDTRKDDYVYVTDLLEDPKFSSCRSDAGFKDFNTRLQTCIKRMDHSCDTIIQAVDHVKPEKCKSGFQPKYHNDTKDYGDVPYANIGHVLYDAAAGLNQVTGHLAMSLKTYAASCKKIHDLAVYYDKVVAAGGTLVRESTDIYASFAGLMV